MKNPHTPGSYVTSDYERTYGNQDPYIDSGPPTTFQPKPRWEPPSQTYACFNAQSRHLQENEPPRPIPRTGGTKIQSCSGTDTNKGVQLGGSENEVEVHFGPIQYLAATSPTCDYTIVEYDAWMKYVRWCEQKGHPLCQNWENFQSCPRRKRPPLMHVLADSELVSAYGTFEATFFIEAIELHTSILVTYDQMTAPILLGRDLWDPYSIDS
ncbi:MAG: hypothetical protein GY818_18410, partial [Planctomycetaceae bacterium]|nr:hypothetical protein [Planctomycetaceae bacterium]